MAETFAGLVSEQLPRLAELVGARALQQRDTELERLGMVPLWQIERDLELLRRRLPWGEIAGAYRHLLRNPAYLVEAMYEIRVAAMLAPEADRLELAPKTGRGRCDLRCELGGGEVFIEVTVKADRFPPLNAYNRAVDESSVYGRVTVETSFATTTAGTDPTIRGIPASKELRDRITQEVTQCPSTAPTVVVVGAPGGRSIDIESALWGDEVIRAKSDGGVWRERVLNGLFAIPDDRGGTSDLSAAVWMKLAPHFYDVRVHSRLFANPLAACPLSPAAAAALTRIFDRRAILERELKRIMEVLIAEYRPERVILFGSLADASPDTVHESSDIDLAIVKPTRLRFVDRVREVVDLLQPRVGLNVLVYTPEELDHVSAAGHFFVRDEILKKGRVLFP